MILMFCGLSGAGKTTLGMHTQLQLQNKGFAVEVIDGDFYRQHFFKELGFNKADRIENMRRMALVASWFSRHGVITVISAINPYATVREEIKQIYPEVKEIYIKCSLPELFHRDTKNLYKRSQLPNYHPEKVYQLTGISHDFDEPLAPDLVIDTEETTVEQAVFQLVHLVEGQGDASIN